MFFRIHLGVGEMGLIQKTRDYLTIRTGLRGEEHGLFLGSYCERRIRRGDGLSDEGFHFGNGGHRLLMQHRILQVVNLSLLELLGLTIIPVLHRTIISCDTAVDLCLRAAVWAGVLFAG